VEARSRQWLAIDRCAARSGFFLRTGNGTVKSEEKENLAKINGKHVVKSPPNGQLGGNGRKYLYIIQPTTGHKHSLQKIAAYFLVVEKVKKRDL
jgi:hypothetical protein